MWPFSSTKPAKPDGHEEIEDLKGRHEAAMEEIEACIDRGTRIMEIPKELLEEELLKLAANGQPVPKALLPSSNGGDTPEIDSDKETDPCDTC